MTDTAIQFNRAVPVLRIFDIAKAREFYLDFLGFRVDWEHRYGDDFPLYLQVSRAGLVIHLSEHHGDACPGSTIAIYMSGIDALHAELTAKAYRYAKPGLSDQGGRIEMQLADPFGNRIRFMQLAGD